MMNNKENTINIYTYTLFLGTCLLSFNSYAMERDSSSANEKITYITAQLEHFIDQFNEAIDNLGPVYKKMRINPGYYKKVEGTYNFNKDDLFQYQTLKRKLTVFAVILEQFTDAINKHITNKEPSIDPATGQATPLTLNDIITHFIDRDYANEFTQPSTGHSILEPALIQLIRNTFIKGLNL